MKKYYGLFPPVVCLIFIISVLFFPFPISYRQFTGDVESVLRSDLYDFTNHTVLDSKVLPASIVILMRNDNNQSLLYIYAEKSPVFARYRLILYPQIVYDDRTVSVDDFLYKNEVRIVNRKIIARSVFRPKVGVCLMGLWTLFFTVQIILDAVRRHRGKRAAAGNGQ